MTARILLNVYQQSTLPHRQIVPANDSWDTDSSDDDELSLTADRLQKPLWMLIILTVCIMLRPWDYIAGLSAIRPVTLMIVLITGLLLSAGYKIQYFQIPLSKTLLVIWLAMLATVPTSYWVGQSAGLAIKHGQFLVYYGLIGTVIVATASLFKLTSALVLSGGVLGAMAIRAMLAGEFAVDGRITGVGEGFASDPNDLAHSLVILAPFAWWALTCAKSFLGRFAAFGCLGLMLVGIVITQSRGGLLSLVAATLVLFLISRHSIAKKSIVAVMISVAAVLLMPDRIRDRYASISTAAQTDESSQSRLAVWKAGGQMFVDHLFTGVGLGNFEQVYGSRYIDRKGAGNVWRSAHNSIVEVATELGIVGLTAWLYFHFMPMWLLWRSRGSMLELDELSDEGAKLVSWIEVLLASLVGCMIGAMFLSKAFDIPLLLVVSLAATATMIAQRWVEQSEQQVQLPAE